ncbi:membrane protein insertion efficiency factor YidD [Chromohalobacter israelensis]|uniref:membrane protein insertion efficiency factor YidD n=1 Tax=Chromohalobacter israelensis TaxID=141390 RepID=UPI003AF7463A
MKGSIWLVRLYQRLAPSRLRDACLFEPTCSSYAILALQKYGFLKGWGMALRRIGTCRPPHGGRDYP